MRDETEMPERLGRYLSARGDGRTAEVLAYEPIVGGYSRLMARAEVRWSDGSSESFVLRGDPPPGQAMMETDRDLEWALLSALGEIPAIRMPAALHYDDVGTDLGTKCIVLEHIDGQSLQAVLNSCSADEGYADHPNDLVDTMAAVHSIEPAAVGSVLETPSDWSTYIGSLIDRFRRADAAHVESIPFLRYVAAWLDAHRPPALPLRLVHSDFQPANIMVDSDGRHLLIDWELAHVGDPREDLGYYNVYSASSGPNLYVGDPEGFLARYRERTGFSEEAVNVDTIAYFSSLAAITVYAQVLAGAGAMALGQNSGLMTTYIVNALTVGHNNFLAGCAIDSETH